jgi:acyl carrier protein
LPTDSEQKLKDTLAVVLGVPSDQIGDETSTDTVANWDSLNHLNLVLAIEEQFNVSFTEEQSFEILSYPLLKSVLAEHGIVFAI